MCVSFYPSAPLARENFSGLLLIIITSTRRDRAGCGEYLAVKESEDNRKVSEVVAPEDETLPCVIGDHLRLRSEKVIAKL